MTSAAVERRLAEIEGRIAALRPRAPPFSWLDFLADDELDELEAIARDASLSGRAWTESERLRLIEIEAASLRRSIRRT